MRPLLCIILLAVAATAGADTMTVSVSAASDDAARWDATFSTSQTLSYIGMIEGGDDTTQDMGFRFSGLNIPQYSTINSAALWLNKGSDNSGLPLDIIFFGEATDDAATFSDHSNWESREASLTADSVVVEAGLSPVNRFIQFGDVAIIIQNLVDRAGWGSGNDIVIFAFGIDEDLVEEVSIRTYDASSAYGAYIKLDWTPPATGAPQVIMVATQ